MEEDKCDKCHKGYEDVGELNNLIIKGVSMWLCRECFKEKLRIK